LFEDITAPSQFSVGGLAIDRINSGVQPNRLYVDDLHPGTVGQGLIANAFLDTIDTRFGASVPRLSEAEILGAAGVVPEPSSLVFMGLSTLALAGYRLRRWKHVSKS
jgi:phospholipase/lecithinase/hemolysin